MLIDVEFSFVEFSLILFWNRKCKDNARSWCYVLNLKAWRTSHHASCDVIWSSAVALLICACHPMISRMNATWQQGMSAMIKNLHSSFEAWVFSSQFNFNFENFNTWNLYLAALTENWWAFIGELPAFPFQVPTDASKFSVTIWRITAACPWYLSDTEG